MSDTAILTKTALQVNIKQATEMLNALEPNGDFTFQTFGDTVNKGGALVKQFHGKLNQLAKALYELNLQGAGVFVTINRTDAQGRKGENITGVRAVFVDFDTPSNDRLAMLTKLDTTGALNPSLIVESSPGKHHAYWIADNIPLNKFTDYQKRLIHFFTLAGDKPDQAIHDTTRVMRLAGFTHLKHEPVLTKIVYPNEGQNIKRYEWAELERFLNSLPTHTEQTSQKQKNIKHKQTSNAIVSNQSTDNHSLPRLTADRIRDLARGRWDFILNKLSYPVSNNPKEPTPCPVCGGKDRFRFDNELGTGSYICSQGNDETIAGDGLSLLVDHAGMTPQQAIASVTSVLNELELISPYDVMDKPKAVNSEYAQKIISELAQLDELSYQLQKKQTANEIGLGVNDLDKIVKQERQGLQLDKVASIVQDTEPHPYPVNANELAHEILELVNNHIACNPAIAVTVTIWIFFSWCVEVAYIAPIAWINAPMPRCGKTQLATLMGKMCKKPIMASSISPPALFRTIERYKPTFIIDEADSFFNGNVDLKNIINCGFSRDNPFVWRCVGDNNEPMPFDVFGAKVISGIGKLAPTVMDRSISLTLRRALPNERKQKVKNLPKATIETIKAKLARWTDDNIDTVAKAKPILPEHVYNREFDTWEILFQIADTLGDDWLQLITNACLFITQSEPKQPSINEELLSDIKAVFEWQQVDRITTRDLLTALISVDEDGLTKLWATINKGQPITDRQLATRLNEFKIKSSKINTSNESQKRGYYLADFLDAFNRYL